jgi:hypothetical protein
MHAGTVSFAVVAGLDPAIHALASTEGKKKTWMPGTRPGMTVLQNPIIASL